MSSTFEFESYELLSEELKLREVQASKTFLLLAVAQESDDLKVESIFRKEYFMNCFGATDGQ